MFIHTWILNIWGMFESKLSKWRIYFTMVRMPVKFADLDINKKNCFQSCLFLWNIVWFNRTLYGELINLNKRKHGRKTFDKKYFKFDVKIDLCSNHEWYQHVAYFVGLSFMRIHSRVFFSYTIFQIFQMKFAPVKSNHFIKKYFIHGTWASLQLI